MGGFVVSRGGGGGQWGGWRGGTGRTGGCCRSAPAPADRAAPLPVPRGSGGAPPRGLGAAGGGGGGLRRHLLPALGHRTGSGVLVCPQPPGRAPSRSRPLPPAPGATFGVFRGRVARGRVPGLSRRGRAGCWGPPAMPGRAGEAGQGQLPGPRQEHGKPSGPRVAVGETASDGFGAGRVWGGLGLPCPWLGGPRAAPPPSRGARGGLPGARDGAAALPGLNTFVFGSWVGELSVHLAFSLFAGKQLPAGASGVKFHRGWGRRGGGGRSRGELSCRAPAQPAGTDPGWISVGGALPASSSSRAGGIPGGALPASSSFPPEGIPGGALPASSSSSPSGGITGGSLVASSSSRARKEALVEEEAGEGEHRRKRNKLQGGPNVGHKSQESRREEQWVDTRVERWS